METTIDNIKIVYTIEENGIQSTTEKLSEFLSMLTQTKNATKGGLGLTPSINQVNRLQESLDRLEVGNKLSSLYSQMEKLSSMDNSGGLKETINSINRMPNMLEKLSGVDLSSLGNVFKNLDESISSVTSGNNITQLALLNTELKDLVEIMKYLGVTPTKAISGFNSLKTSSNSLSQSLRSIITSIRDIGNESQSTKAKTDNFLDSMIKKLNQGQNSLGYFIARFFSFRGATNLIRNGIQQINDYTENIALMNTAMGEYSQQAWDYAQKVGEVANIDPSAWIRGQSTYMNMANGFGIASDEAYKMSDALTKLAYDYSALYNTDVDTMMIKIQGAMAGQIEPMRRYGVTISEAKLQEIAYAQGLSQKVSELDEAGKAQLRYLAIYEQSVATNVMGAFARESMQPANALRILQSQVTQLTRAFGSLFIPILMKTIPHIIAFVKVVTNAVRAIASFFGFNLPEISGDWGTIGGEIGGVGDAIDDIGTSAGTAGKGVSKLKEELKGLASFDQLHVMTPDKEPVDSSGGSGGGSGLGGIGGGGLDLDLPSYDGFLDGITDQVNALIPLWEKWGVVIGIVAGLLAGIWVLNKVMAFAEWIKKVGEFFGIMGKAGESASAVSTSAMLGLVAGIALVAGGLFALLNNWNDLSVAGRVFAGVAIVVGGGLIAVGVSAITAGTSFATAFSIATFGIGALIGAMVALVAMFAGWAMGSEKAHNSVKDLEQATINLEEAQKNLESATLSNIDATKKWEEATDKLTEAEERNQISGADLQRQVDDGILTYKDMNAAQREVYEAYSELQQAETDMINTEKDLQSATKDTILAKLDEQVANADTAESYEDYKQAVIDAFESGAISADEAQDQMSKALGHISTDSRDTFIEDLPSDIKNGLDVNKYSSTGRKLGDFLSGIWEGMTSSFDSAINWITDEFEKFGNWLGGIGNSIGSFFGGFSLFSMDLGGTLDVGSSIPSFAKGSNFIKRDGLAFVHKGETIVPTEDTKAYESNRNQFDDTLVNQLEEVIKIVRDISRKDIEVTMDDKKINKIGSNLNDLKVKGVG